MARRTWDADRTAARPVVPGGRPRLRFLGTMSAGEEEGRTDGPGPGPPAPPVVPATPPSLTWARADRLDAGQQLVELAGLDGRDEAVDQRRQLVLRRHRDAGLALLELDGPGAVVDRHDQAARAVGAPPGPDLLLLLDLPALVALAGPALDDADVGGVGEQRLLLLEALGELVAAGGDRVVSAGGDGGEGEVLQDRHGLSPLLREIGLYSVLRRTYMAGKTREIRTT